jgi:hypothetical protein
LGADIRFKPRREKFVAMIEKLIQFEADIMGNMVTLETAPVSQPSLADRIKAANG